MIEAVEVPWERVKSAKSIYMQTPMPSFPGTYEYMHMGETATRFLMVTPRMVSG